MGAARKRQPFVSKWVQMTLPLQVPAVVVTGSRKWTDEAAIRRPLAALPPKSVVIHGAAMGADSIAAALAKELGHEVIPFRPEYARYGRYVAPLKRNLKMLDHLRELQLQDHVTQVFSFPLLGGTGTQHCTDHAIAQGFETITFCHLKCPKCGKRHVDQGIWAARPHHTHRCVPDDAGLKACGHEWRIEHFYQAGI